MKEELADLKVMKEDIFENRLKMASERKTEEWTMVQLNSALKLLKKNKSRDPNGWANELFKDGVAGQQFKLSLLHMLNKMKEKNEIPGSWI